MSATKDQYSAPLDSDTATISTGTSLSAPILTGGLRLFRVGCPAVIPTAAVLTFQGYNGATETWNNIYDGDTELTYTLAALKDINVDHGIFSSYNQIKFRSGTASAPVNQAADLTLGVVMRLI